MTLHYVIIPFFYFSHKLLNIFAQPIEELKDIAEVNNAMRINYRRKDLSLYKMYLVEGSPARILPTDPSSIGTRIFLIYVKVKLDLFP